MPTYNYKCTNEECGIVIDHDAKMSDFKDQHPACTECGSLCEYFYIPSVPQIAFKDGPSGSWPSKGDRINKQMKARSEAAALRQRERYGETRGVVPNFNGQQTESWAEAQSIALKEKGSESASTFNGKIKEEKEKDKKVKVYSR